MTRPVPGGNGLVTVILKNVLVEWALLLTIVYFPPLAGACQTTPLTPLLGLSLLIGPILLLTAEEIRKWFLYRRTPPIYRVFGVIV